MEVWHECSPAAVLLLAAFIGSSGTAAAQQPAPAGVPEISGGWLQIDVARITPSMYGHSTGRYEGSALIVETIGLSAALVRVPLSARGQGVRVAAVPALRPVR